MKVALGGIFEISSGGTPSKTHAEYYNGNIPWVKTGDLKSEYLNSVDEYITDKGLKNSSAKMYEPGTVLLAMYGATIGAASILTFDACTNQACAAFKPCKDVIPEYLYYFLLSRREKFIHDGVGGAQPNISGRYLKQVEFELYPINEQRYVISVLDRVNRVILLKKEELKKLDELIKARFVEMFGNLREGECKVIKLGELCNTVSGGTPSTKFAEYYEGDIPWITTTSLGPNHIDGTTAKAFITKKAIDNSATKLIPAGNILFGTRVGVGKSSLNDVDICTNQDIVAIVGIDENRFNKLFIKYVLDFYQPYYDSIKKGATILGITSDDLKNTIVPDVSLCKQNAFETFVEQIDKSKFAVQKSLDETQLLFDKLMQEYFG